MATGTPITIGFRPTSQSPIDERAYNDGIPFVDEAEVLSLIPLEIRHVSIPVNIAGVEYRFNADLLGLTAFAAGNDQTASEVPIVDAADIYVAENAEDALQEIMGYAIALNADIEAIVDVKGNPYKMSMPSGDIATKVAGATFTPTGWGTVEQSGTTNILITSVLTGRQPTFINVFEIDGTVKTLLSIERGMAYSQHVNDGLETLLYGFAPTTLAVEVSLIFD